MRAKQKEISDKLIRLSTADEEYYITSEYLLQLAEMGKGLIDESGNCPLCDVVWKSGELEVYLQDKISKGKEFAEHNKTINRLSSAISSRINNTIASIRGLPPENRFT